jgi:hypothetical protein
MMLAGKWTSILSGSILTLKNKGFMAKDKGDKGDKVIDLVIERLKLPDVKQDLYVYWGLPNDIEFFPTTAFSSLYHKKWDEYERAMFINTLAGKTINKEEVKKIIQRLTT